MDYLSLFKKFVISNDSEAKKLYEERFNSESCFHFPFKINGHDAFFFAHPKIYEKVCQIYKRNQDLTLLCSLLPYSAQNSFIKKCLIDEIQYTNEIEGVISNRKEISSIINDIKNNRHTKNIRLEGIVNSYINLINDKEITLSTPKDIRKIYDDLLLHEISIENSKNVPDGELFRKEKVEVDNIQGEPIHSGVYPEKDIIDYMDKSLNILNKDDIDPLLRMLIFHYLFGYIHPFYDGNGRMSRFISSYLISKNLSPILALTFSAGIKENLSDYYKTFKHTNDPRNFGDIGTFVNTMLDIMLEQEEKTIRYFNGKRKFLDLYLEKIDKITKSKRECDFLFLLVQASLFSDSGLSMVEMTSILDMDQKTIKLYSNKYVDIVNVCTKSRHYLYSANLDALK